MYNSPLQVDLDITMNCNLDCIHCCADAKFSRSNELSYNEITNLIDELYDMGVTNITIAGGEPLIRKDCLDIVYYCAQKRGMMVTLVTNGLLLKKEHIKFLEKKVPNCIIAISLDAANECTFNAVRTSKQPKKNYKRVLDSIELLLDSKLYFSINYVITNLNINDFWQTYKLFNDKGVPSFTVLKFISTGRGYKNRDKLEMEYKTWSNFLCELTKLKLEGKHSTIGVSTACPYEVYLPLIENGYTENQIESIWNYQSPLKSEIYKKNYNLGCHAGKTNLSICSDGNVYPCSVGISYNELIMGNIREASIKSIWKESIDLNNFRNIQLSDIDGKCSDCKISHLCGGGCRIRAFAYTNDIHGKDVSCPII